MDKRKVRSRLNRERERLDGIRRELRWDSQGTADGAGVSELSNYDQHPGDIGSEVFEHEKNVSILEQVEAELTEVNAAIQRLEAGEYGRCQACGEPIKPQRLDQVPLTRFCVEDQRRAERDAGLPGGVRGALDSVHSTWSRQSLARSGWR